MLTQRRRRWAKTNPASGKLFVFARRTALDQLVVHRANSKMGERAFSASPPPPHAAQELSLWK